MAIVDTLGIADELSRDGVFSREQAERLARVSGRAAIEALVTKTDLASEAVAIRTELANEATAIRAEISSLRIDLEHTTSNLRNAIEANGALLRSEFDAKLQANSKELVKWFAGILLAHGIAVVGVMVTLVKLL
jgi:hypothetical protein